MEHVNRQHGLWGLGLCLAVGLVVSAMVGAGALKRVKLAHQTITVKGYAEKPITSDHGVWSGWFEVEGVELQRAYAELEQHHDRVVTWLEQAGVKPAMIRSTAVSTEPLYKKDSQGRDTHELEKYQLSQTVVVEGKELEWVERIAQESTELIKQGIRFTSGKPAYYFTGLEGLKVQMLGEAMKNARERAAVLAENSNARVGPLVQASQGVYQITPPFDTEIDDYGRNDTSSIHKVIKAVITADFAVE